MCENVCEHVCEHVCDTVHVASCLIDICPYIGNPTTIRESD